MSAPQSGVAWPPGVLNRETTLEVLTQHNAWRRGAVGPQTDPRMLGLALDAAIAALSKGQSQSAQAGGGGVVALLVEQMGMLRDALFRLTRLYESEHDPEVLTTRPDWLRQALAIAEGAPLSAPAVAAEPAMFANRDLSQAISAVAREMAARSGEGLNPRVVEAYSVPLYATPQPAAAAVLEAVRAVMGELERATRKFPTWPTDPLHACGVVQEESGELAKAVLQAVYEPHKSTLEDVRAEAIQTAAMAIRFVMSMGLYDWTPGQQHKQEPLAAAQKDGA